jgi:hypothetical protein
MRKRVVAIATILFLIIFEFSCMMYSLNKESPEKAAFHQGTRNEVWAVMKISKRLLPQKGKGIGC